MTHSKNLTYNGPNLIEVAAKTTTDLHSLRTTDIEERAQLSYQVRCMESAPMVVLTTIEVIRAHGHDRSQELGLTKIKVQTYSDVSHFFILLDPKSPADVMLSLKLCPNLATIDGSKPRYKFNLTQPELIKLRVIDFCEPCSVQMKCAVKYT